VLEEKYVVDLKERDAKVGEMEEEREKLNNKVSKLEIELIELN